MLKGKPLVESREEDDNFEKDVVVNYVNARDEDIWDAMSFCCGRFGSTTDRGLQLMEYLLGNETNPNGTSDNDDS